MITIRWGIFILLGIAIGSPAFGQSTYDTLPNSPAHYKARMDRFNKEPVVTGKILFLGNGLIESGNWRRLLKDSTIINRGISGDNTFGVLQRTEDVTRRKPLKIFLLIGVDDLSKNIPTATVLENIFSIVSKIRSGTPKSQIFVQSLLPVNTTLKDFPAAYAKQETILELNGLLKKYSVALKFTYVDIHDQFLNKQNMLDNRFTPDGLHLNAAGYVHWVDFLKKNKFL